MGWFKSTNITLTSGSQVAIVEDGVPGAGISRFDALFLINTNQMLEIVSVTIDGQGRVNFNLAEMYTDPTYTGPAKVLPISGDFKQAAKDLRAVRDKVDAGADANFFQDWRTLPQNTMEVLDGEGNPTTINTYYWFANGFNGLYDLWLAAGNVGTLNDFLATITGPAGTDGVDGADGGGVPAGGTTNQVLAKLSNTDQDVGWVNEAAASGGATTANELTDVTIAAPSASEVLRFNGSLWVNTNLAIGDVTSLQTALDSKSDTGHSHAVSDTTGLQAELDSKLVASAYAMPTNPKRLLIYYGYPIAYAGLWDAQAVIDAIARNYDIWICGDTYQDPGHAEYSSTSTIISGLLAKGVEVWGYVPLGQSTSNLTIATITTRIGQWNTLGVDGIFLDEFGFDYQNTRQRQIDAVNACAAVGLPYCANAWTWEDVTIDDVVDLPGSWAVDDWRKVNFETYNPTNLVLPRSSSDAYLMESWGMIHTGPSNKFQFHERAVLNNASNPDNLRLWAVAVLPENPVGTFDTAVGAPFTNAQSVCNYVTAAAYIHGLDCIGVNGYTFGSGGSTTFVTKAPRLPDALRGTTAGTASFNAVTGLASRTFGDHSLDVTCEEGAGTYTWSVDMREDLYQIQHAGG